MKQKFVIPEKNITISTSANFPVTAYSEFFMENFPDVRDKNVLDFGVGSGILSAFAIRSGASKVTAIDITDEAIELARHNMDANNMSDKFMIGDDLYANIQYYKNTIDVIICNPASLPTNKDLPSFCNGGFWGTGMIFQLLDLTKTLLNKDGVMYFIHTSLVPFSLVIKYMEERFLKYEPIKQKDILFRPFYSEIMAHILNLKEKYPEISYTDRDGNVFETISLLKVTK